MDNNKQIFELIKKTLNSKKFAVITTMDENNSHPTLVAFIISDDLKRVHFATPKNTRKCKNIIINPRVSLFLDTQHNNPDDINNAITITGYANAEVIDERANQLEQIKKKYLEIHPYMKDFASEPHTVFVEMKMEEFEILVDFQKVIKIKINESSG